jgi:hypothetical protein
MRTSTSGLILIVCTCLFFAQPSLAGVLAVWDFGDSSAFYTENPAYYHTAAAPTLVLSGGTKDPDGKNGIAFTDAAGVAHIAGQAGAWDDIKVNGLPNASWLITLNTTGFQSLSIRWDYRSEKATSFDLAYRLTAGGSWAQLADNSPITVNWAAGTWNSVMLDLSGFSALNNQSYLQLRLDDLVQGSGNDKFAFDNLELTGVPEPVTLLLLGLGGLILKKGKRTA